MGMDDAHASRASEAVSRGVVLAVRRPRVGNEDRSRAWVRQLRPSARSGVRTDNARAGRIVRRFLRRLYRAAIRRDPAGSGHVAGVRLIAGARVGTERAPAAIRAPSVALRARVRREGAAAALAGDSRGLRYASGARGVFASSCRTGGRSADLSAGHGGAGRVSAGDGLRSRLHSSQGAYAHRDGRRRARQDRARRSHTALSATDTGRHGTSK